MKIRYTVYTDADGMIYAECSDDRFNIPPMNKEHARAFVRNNENIESVHVQNLIQQIKEVLPIGFLEEDM